MSRYTIKATVFVDVELSIEATDKGHARALLDSHLIVTAGMIDLPASDWDVSEDSISDVSGVTIEKEGERP